MDVEEVVVTSNSRVDGAAAEGGGGSAGAAADGLADAAGELGRLQADLAQAQAQAAEYLDGWQRAQAEFANFRKRQEAERAQMIAYATANLLRKLLPVVDDFGRALETLPGDAQNAPWAQGVLLIRRKLEGVLESENAKPIEIPVGSAFDPLTHEAVSYERAPGRSEGEIIGVVRQGYTIGERVLRPAQVRVAQAPLEQTGNDDRKAADKE